MLTMSLGGQRAMPDKASAQVNDTVTLVLFQPAGLGAGAAVVLMVGAVLSILTVSVAVLPATSLAVPCTTWLALWAVTMTGAVHEATPEVASAQVKSTV